MVDVKDLLQMSYYELSPFTGSDGEKRFRIEKVMEGEGDDAVKRLQVTLWYGRFAYDHTPKEDMAVHTESFDHDGLERIAEWINGEG